MVFLSYCKSCGLLAYKLINTTDRSIFFGARENSVEKENFGINTLLFKP